MALTIRHQSGSYPVQFCEPEEALSGLPVESFIVTDQNVAEHWSTIFPANVPTLTLQPGEHTKRLSEFGRVCEWLAASGATRKSTVVALGGGVIGDLVGFVAASYMRGVELVQIPTTLLAQVDSSVGGKVGVDLAGGKNLVGAFKPPARVEIGIDFLKSLPARHIRNGMAEVLKYAFIVDQEVLRLVQSSSTSELVRRCIEIKSQIVEQDEFEKTGLRATLNFGHTVGHAIEAALGYERLLHGEAISIGMVAEAEIGERMGFTAPGTRTDIEAHLIAAGLPVQLPGSLDPEKLIEFMARDKKAARGELKMSLLTRVGECKLVGSVPEQTVRSVLAEL